jgi:hypothetical protein
MPSKSSGERRRRKARERGRRGRGRKGAAPGKRGAPPCRRCVVSGGRAKGEPPEQILTVAVSAALRSTQWRSGVEGVVADGIAN